MVTAYVRDEDLLCYDCNAYLRRATPAERRESMAERPTGAISASVSERTDREAHDGRVKCYRFHATEHEEE